MPKHWTPGAFPAPRPAEWRGMNSDRSRILWARANRFRNEIEQSRSRTEAQVAAVRFLYSARAVIVESGREITPPMMVAIEYVGRLTTDLFARECNAIARTMAAIERGYP